MTKKGNKLNLPKAAALYSGGRLLVLGVGAALLGAQGFHRGGFLSSNFFFTALGFELRVSCLLGRLSYCLNHFINLVLCWVFFEIGA
jgi:hypothetical protein